MSKSNTWENGLLLLLFNNTAFTLVGDAGGLLASAGDGDIYVSLHTGDPGEAGDQTTNEATFTSYARVAISRTAAAGWTVAANAVSNTVAVTFPACTGLSDTITYVGIGTSSAAAGKLLYSGALSASLAVSAGITAEFAIGDLDVTED